MNKAKKRIDFLCYLGLGFGSLMVLIPIMLSYLVQPL